MRKENAEALLTQEQLDRIVEMAWEDRTPFDAIKAQFGVAEQEVIAIMRRALKPTSWRMWRERVQGRATKHAALSAVDDGRFKSRQQRVIAQNKVAKRG